jgi:G3E family GTPase
MPLLPRTPGTIPPSPRILRRYSQNTATMAAMAESKANDDARVPVTVLTGFLGSGKTTLLNYILSQDHGKKIAIIENEFGDVGIDDALLAKNTREQADEEIIEMMNGCICCTVRQDLIVVLKKLAARIKSGTLHLDGIVIETTGLADPAPVAQTFFVDDEVQKFARLDGIVTMVDAKHIEQHLDVVKPEGVENEAVEQVAFADRLIVNKTDLVTEEDLVRVEARLRVINAFAPLRRSHKSEVSVDDVLNIRAFDLDRTLKMDAEFLALDAEHEHDVSVTSISIILPGVVDLDDINAWISSILQEKGADIYRMKGVIAMDSAPTKFVYQAVHMIFNGDWGDAWEADEERISKLVFIGKNLNKEELEAGFKACLSTTETKKAKLEALRFKIGDKVKCCVGTNANGKIWETGVIDELMFRTDDMPPGMVAAYSVELDSGGGIYAPQDSDKLIQAA